MSSNLGVFEFCSSLNGDDALLIIQRLQQFVNIVKCQRRSALLQRLDGASSKNGHGDEQDVHDDDPSANESKRSNIGDVPSWQMDTRNYNVPFVGTSVPKGPVGTWLPNVWPCGLLKAYLDHSPMGAELVGNEFVGSLPPGGIHRDLSKIGDNSGDNIADNSGSRKRKRGYDVKETNLSLKLQFYYWMAVSEWILGFVNKEKLILDLEWNARAAVLVSPDNTVANHDNPNNPDNTADNNVKACIVPQQAMKIILKQRLVEWIDVIQNQVSQLLLQNQKHKRLEAKNSKERTNHPKNGPNHVHQSQSKPKQDQTALAAIQGINSLLLLSHNVAEEVFHALHHRTNAVDSRLIDWPCTLFQQPLPITTTNENEHMNQNLQSECLRMASLLLETNDIRILSVITQVPKRFSKAAATGSSTENYFSVVYSALRYGIPKLLECHVSDEIHSSHGISLEIKDAYAHSMARLLHNVRTRLLPPEETREEIRDNGKMSRNRLATLGFIIGITATADLLSGDVLHNLTQLSLHAPLLFDSSVEIIQSSEKDIASSPLSTAAIEAQRLLFLLLSDPHSSPLLAVRRPLHLTQLAQSLHAIARSRGYTVPSRVLVNRCLNATPALLPLFFRCFHRLDIAPNYRSLASLHFVERVIDQAPPPTVLGADDGSDGASDILSEIIDSIVPSCVTRTFLGKIAQSSCSLLVSSGLKLIITILRRVQSINVLDFAWITDVRQRILHRLPEVSLLLSIPSKFDPFQRDNPAKPSSSRANAIVILQLCRAIRWYGQLDPRMLCVKFDWAKWVPVETPYDQHDIRLFHNAEPLLQHAILQLLLTIFDHVSFSSKMLPCVLSVMMFTHVPEVYEMARQLSLLLTRREMHPNEESLVSVEDKIHAESNDCREYESSLWVDGIDSEILHEFVSSLEQSRRWKVQHKIMVSRAWTKTSADILRTPDDSPLLKSTPGFSPLLSFSICRVFGNSSSQLLSKKFVLLLTRIVTKMLVFVIDPIPLASLVVVSSNNLIHGNDHPRFRGDGMMELVTFAKGILRKDEKSNSLLKSVACKIFPPKCDLNLMIQMTNANSSLSQKIQAINSNSFLESLDDSSIMVTLRQCFHLLMCPDNQYDSLNALLRKILIKALELLGHKALSSIPRILSMLHISILKPADLECIILILHSFPNSNQSDAPILLDSSISSKSDSSYSEGMNVISTILRCKWIPSGSRCKYLDNLWKNCNFVLQSKHDSHWKHFQLTLLLYTIPKEIGPSSSISFPLDEMFDLWSLLASNITTTLSLRACLRLENILAKSFSSLEDGPGTWAVYQRISKISPEKFVELCMTTLRHSKEAAYDDDDVDQTKNAKTFFQSVLQYDCSMFSSFSSTLANINNDETMLWENGSLDAIAATFLLQTNSQTHATKIRSNASYDQAMKVIGQRILGLLAAYDGTNMRRAKFEIILDVLQTLCSNDCMVAEIETTLLGLFDLLSDSSGIIPIERDIRLAEISIMLSSKCGSSQFSILLSKTFLRCCSILPKHLKKMVRGKKESPVNPLQRLMYCSFRLLENVSLFDKTTITDSSSIIDNCLVSCLKYGMTDTSEWSSCSVFGGCLKLIRLILIQCYGRLSNATFVSTKLTPRQIHAMIISHSSFKSAIDRKFVPTNEVSFDGANPLDSKSDNCVFFNDLTQQMELIRLMLCCMSFDADHILIDKETWRSIFSVYNASTSDVDRSLRRLLYLYEQHSLGENEIMMDEHRWGSMATKESPSFGSEHWPNWEWFIEALDNYRVRLTLSQYPVSDTLEPFLDDVECTSKQTGETKDDTNLESMADSEDDSDDGSGAAPSSVDPRQLHSNTFSSSRRTNDKWRGTGVDLRYSPGFILPLILGAIESFLLTTNDCESESKDGENGHNDKGNKDECAIPMIETGVIKNAQYQTFIHISRKICDKGGITLALASLSSRCPQIRQLAIAICSLFLKALQMQEAQEIKSWRERPQLEMLLSSVQRGLAVRRSMQIKKAQEQDNTLLEDNHFKYKIHVPMLPAVSAVFLAKALTILSKPTDDMYGPMNRYFLKLEDFHGAYQDCFGLPAFLSLYCSSSDNISRCRIERNWALLSLKDSVVDEFCYQIVAQHHIPELIMTSFDCLVDHSVNRNEHSITLDVLKNLIVSGSTRASSHLIKRLGLLSWLHGVVSWRKVSSVFPSLVLKCKFFELVIAAVKSYNSSKLESQGENDVHEPEFFEKVALSRAIIRVFLETPVNQIDNVTSSNNLQTKIVTLAGNALWEIHLADQKFKGNTNPVIESIGLVSLTEMSMLLKVFLTRDDMLPKVLASLCSMPFLSTHNDMQSVYYFCDVVLGFILEVRSRISSGIFVILLKRIGDLVMKYPSIVDRPDFSSQVLRCRHLASSMENGIDIWDSFIPFLEKR